ncbi:ADP-ribosylglycohydrolase-domain-containing protein [Auriculariales sp. MPI-PUGE-AT-0066]|nr:ADP-ribosylglycohydrolase-domain-containing protein [Auriculariales sp. MPI-PUGE-AT-0066]
MSSPPFPPSSHDRLLGCLIGGALGDAIGLFTEFLPKAESAQLYGSTPSLSLLPPGSHPLATPNMKAMHMDRHRGMFSPGSWTDDTDQSLLILLSWLRSGGTTLDPKDFAQRLKVWCREGLRALARPPLGLGRTVGASVHAPGWLEDPIGIAREKWESTGRVVAPNGAVMRTAIIGCLCYQDKDGVSGLDRAFFASMQLGATTHADPRCLVSCAIVSGIIVAIMRGELASEQDVRGIVTAALAFLEARPEFPDKLSENHRAELEQLYVWPSSLDQLALDERKSIGYTYKCLGSAMWALRKALEWRANGQVPDRDMFERIITDITMEGGDADTNAVVAGAIVGCYLGVQGLCYRWAVGLGEGERAGGETVGLREWLTQKGEAACVLLGISEMPAATYDPTTDHDTLLYGAEDAVALTDKEMDDMMWGKVMAGMAQRMGHADDPKYNQPVPRHSAKSKNGDCTIM